MSEVELKSRLETDEDGGGKEAGKGLRRITMSVDGGSIEGECAGKERQVRARVTRQYPATKWAKEDTTETESKPGSSSVSGEECVAALCSACIHGRLEALLFRSASS